LKKVRKLLVGDVGGTNCRLAACDPTNGTISHITIFPVRELESLEEALDHFKGSHQEHSYSEAAISIANPITGDQIAMTNAHWDFSIERTRQNCRLNQLIMLNDWESVALSLPLLAASDLEQINNNEANELGNRALCGVGTGLGVAGLVRGKGSGWFPVAGEGGHVSFSPLNHEEVQILETLRDVHDHVSFEKILSGAGLVALHQAINRIAGFKIKTLSPQNIVSQAATANDPICEKTVEVFCRVLGNFAGNLSLTLGATGGIYIGGGVIQKMQEAGIFDRDEFLSGLTRKGRLSDWLSNIPAYLIKTPFAGLIGSAAALGVDSAWVSVEPTVYRP